jgi:hypothetical protein
MHLPLIVLVTMYFQPLTLHQCHVHQPVHVNQLLLKPCHSLLALKNAWRVTVLSLRAEELGSCANMPE